MLVEYVKGALHQVTVNFALSERKEISDPFADDIVRTGKIPEIRRIIVNKAVAVAHSGIKLCTVSAEHSVAVFDKRARILCGYLARRVVDHRFVVIGFAVVG